MIHQAVVGLLLSLATSFFLLFFWPIWTLGSRLNFQFILQMNYQFLIHGKRDRNDVSQVWCMT